MLDCRRLSSGLTSEGPDFGPMETAAEAALYGSRATPTYRGRPRGAGRRKLQAVGKRCDRRDEYIPDKSQAEEQTPDKSQAEEQTPDKR